MSLDCLIAASEMITGEPFADYTKLNSDLRSELEWVESLVQKAGGKLFSRQVIAVAIVNWQMRNPGVRSYG